LKTIGLVLALVVAAALLSTASAMAESTQSRKADKSRSNTRFAGWIAPGIPSKKEPGSRR
jgi:hypothetical protein